MIRYDGTLLDTSYITVRLDYLLGEKICLVCFVEGVSYYMTILLSGGTIAIVSFLFKDCYVGGRSPRSCWNSRRNGECLLP